MNHYEFPLIFHLDEVRKAIADRPEFVVAEREYGTIVNYILHMPTTFYDEDPVKQALLRECRGIIFHPTTGRVIARRLHKFFNVGEKEETLPKNIDVSGAHRIYTKLDGSMITPIPVDGKIRWGTKMGLTDVAAQAEAFVDENPKYEGYARLCAGLDVTPIFEWTSRKQRIILDYATDDLKLIAIRHNITGQYAPHDVLLECEKDWNIPLCDSFSSYDLDLLGFLKAAASLENIEGYVIRFDDGHMLKVKSDWYCRIHSAKERLLFEKDVIRMIIDEELDDIKSVLLLEDLKRLQTFEQEFGDGLIEAADQFAYGLSMLHEMYATKKDFALSDIGQNPQFRRENSIAFYMWDRGDEDLLPHLKNLIRKNLGSQTKVDSIRWLWGEARWLPGVVDDNDRQLAADES